MSLIVAQATDRGPRIVSDIRAAYPDKRRPKFKTDTLKAIVVAPNATVCFAGDVDAGLKGVREFAKGLEQCGSIASLLPGLHELASDDRRPVDFIVASVEGSSQLTRIRSGETERTLQIAWIGDQRGFELFQIERNKPLEEPHRSIESMSPPAAKLMNTLRRAMEAVIDNPAVESVDGVCVAVAYKPRGFEYLSSTFIHVGRDIVVQPEEELIGKMAQSVEEGGYTVSVVKPAQPGVPALGLNFPQARLGMLFLPLQFDGAQVIQDVSPKDFSKVVLERFGIGMEDPMLR